MTATLHDTTAEQAVLGAAILAPDVLSELRRRPMAADDFANGTHGLIWSALCTLADAGKPTDPVVLAAHLDATGHLQRVGGAPYLHTLIAAVPTTANASYYADIVRAQADQRRALMLAEKVRQMAASGSDPAAIVATAQKMLDDISTRTGSASGDGRSMRLTPASTIAIRPVSWLWADRIPASAITIVPGREGIGKSLLLAWLTSQITRGTLPGRHFGRPRAVIYAASEDSWAHTIAPRLVAAGADLDLVYRVDVEHDGVTDQLTLPRDCASLAVEIERLGVALLAADPLLSLIHAGIDTHRDRDLRTALEPLAKLADQAGCAVVGLAHFNKSASSDALNLITGSRAFSAVARAVMAVARDGDADDGSCVLSQAKSNLGRLDVPSLRYVIESCELPTDEGPAHVGRLVFTGESDRSVSDILGEGAADGEPREERDGAAAWLADYLVSNGGEAAWADLIKAARAEGIAERTLRRARTRARVTVTREGFPSKSIWRLTIGDTASPATAVGMQSGHTPASAANSQNVAALAALRPDWTNRTPESHPQSPQDDLMTGATA